METLNDAKLRKNRPAHEFVESIHYKVGRLKRQRIQDSLFIVGKCVAKDVGKNLKEELLQRQINYRTILQFERLLKDKFLYTSKSYERPKRTCNYIIVYEDSKEEEKIAMVKNFIRVQVCHCSELCDHDGHHFAIVKKCNVEHAFRSPISDEMINYIYLFQSFDKQSFLIDIKKNQINLFCFASN